VQINKREEIVSEIRYHDFGGIKCVAWNSYSTASWFVN
jgi:hypothetical protein